MDLIEALEKRVQELEKRVGMLDRKRSPLMRRCDDAVCQKKGVILFTSHTRCVACGNYLERVIPS